MSPFHERSHEEESRGTLVLPARLPPWTRARRASLVLLAALGGALAPAARAASPAGEPAVEAPRAAAPADEALADTPQARVVWQERFDRRPLDWVDPVDHGAARLARVYSVQQEGPLSFLRALHDFTASDPPPAMHYGHAFQANPTPLDKVRALRWKWRARRHPSVSADPWLDVAASVYVVIKTPGAIFSGKGFKFGWLARPGPLDTHQRGLLQVGLRAGPPTPDFRAESVDLCALFRKEYGRCEGEKVLYVGVVTDADGTKSVAEADYADFELVAAP